MYFDSPYVAKVNLSLGEGCLSSNECASGCCVIERKRHVCKNLAQLNENCSTGQVKGGFYPKFCPCADDNNLCKRQKGRRGRSTQICTAPTETTTTF
ncbi:uncharacterized protein B4U80_09498 [Leptotrombidium deliense]|uniref:Uncharacterized protein n=1 Tax=Leptotrombidium deliense TaxID=299467 RepID=A0A443SNS6_9ACAR|nr:uncharacterized protein B4U80_09498 [Leptotrombidium deliense]